MTFTSYVYRKLTPDSKMNLFGNLIGGDKNEVVFNSNAEINRKTDADTAILLNHPSLQFDNIREDSGGRILNVEIRCDSFVFQMLNIYAFTSSYPKQKKEGFFNQIYDISNIISTKILGGDFNCLENPTLNRYPPKNTTISESKQLTEFLQTCKMFDCAIQLPSTKLTFFSENSSSRIDRIYATNDVNAVSVPVSPNRFSDHNAVVAQIDIHSLASVARERILEEQCDMLSKRNLLKRFRNKMENLDEKTK